MLLVAVVMSVLQKYDACGMAKPRCIHVFKANMTSLP
jgi:hypothetical protein